MGAKRKIEIRKVSRFVIWITLFLALVFVFLIIQGENEFFARSQQSSTFKPKKHHSSLKKALIISPNR